MSIIYYFLPICEQIVTCAMSNIRSPFLPWPPFQPRAPAHERAARTLRIMEGGPCCQEPLLQHRFGRWNHIRRYILHSCKFVHHNLTFVTF